jgi:hypothetical protein
MLGMLKMYDNIEVHVDVVFGSGEPQLRQNGSTN